MFLVGLVNVGIEHLTLASRELLVIRDFCLFLLTLFENASCLKVFRSFLKSYVVYTIGFDLFTHNLCVCVSMCLCVYVCMHYNSQWTNKYSWWAINFWKCVLGYIVASNTNSKKAHNFMFNSFTREQCVNSLICRAECWFFYKHTKIMKKYMSP